MLIFDTNNIKAIKYFEKNKNDNYFSFLANIIDECNFNCAYCYNDRPRSNIKLNLNILYNYIQHFQLVDARYIEIDILGGEPTLHPDLIQFCEKISHLKNISVLIFSNLSHSLDFYMKMMQYNNIYFDFSYHSINNKINFDFINKIKKLYKTKYKNKLSISMMLETKHLFDINLNILKMFQQLSNINILNIDFRLIKSYYGYNNSYSETQIKKYLNIINNIKYNKIEFKLLKTNNLIDIICAEEIDTHKNINFKSWKCKAGYENLYCHVNGDLYNCHSEYIQHTSVPIANIYSDFYMPVNKFIICKCTDCACDWGITKYNTKYINQYISF